MGRPSEFSPEIANEICERLAKGKSLRSICADEEAGWLPSARTVHRWLASTEEWADAFRQQYAHAREAQADTLAEEILEIADQPNERVTAEGEVVKSDPQRDRLRVDARKWLASKLAPKKYGEKVTQELTGPEGAPLQVIINKPA